MLGLLGILASRLAVGKLAHRITPAVEVLLILLVAAIVLIDFGSWATPSGSGGDHLWQWLGIR